MGLESGDMAIQHRILYRIVDEDGQKLFGIHDGSEDVRELLEVLHKKYRDAQYMYLELEETYDDGDLTEEERQILLGLEQD